MAGICNTCKYFRADVHPGDDKTNHCDFQDVGLSEAESEQNCDECVPGSGEGKSCCH